MRNKKHPNRIWQRKTTQSPQTQKSPLNHFVLTHPELSFFQKNPSQETISNIKRRIYGITYSTREQRNICKHFSHNPHIKIEKLSKIIHKTQCLANQLAYNSHNGKHWQRDNLSKMQQWLFNQLECGRSMEVLLAEAMIQYSKNGYHFLPVKELDLHYKTDLMSRIPYHEDNQLKTINFGMQITLADILEENNRNSSKKSQTRYQEKYEQVENIVDFLTNSQTQKEITQKYGRIYTSDIMSYTGINGIIKAKITNSQSVSHYFKKWRSNNFDKEWLLEFFDQEFQEAIKMVAYNISQTQNYILSRKFLLDVIKNFRNNHQKWFQKHYHQNKDFQKNINYNPHQKTLTLTIYYHNEILSKTTFFLTESVMKKLFSIHEAV